jgi:peptidoglycan/xylan/chitin deacetylase (PgdA/CDA1 family)
MTSLSISGRKARLDRILSLMLFGPLACVNSAGRCKKIPVLMYHSISTDKENIDHPYFSVNTAPSVFADQMAYLSAHGYKAVSLDVALDVIHSEKHNHEKRVVLTFDDGYLDIYADAHEILNRHGFTATVFLPTAYIRDGVGAKFKGKECLSWEKVRELSESGYRFGSHSETHRILKLLNRSEIEKEIKASKDTIEQNIGKRVESFSYPYAFPEEDAEYKADLRRLLVESGYQNGVSTSIGRISKEEDPYFLKRIPINTFDDPALFKVKMEGGYDWLHRVQYLYKVAKSGMLSQKPGMA